ncbi:unnamed protein product, partial [Soboliphyme baturini]|uniref:BLVR domain-containing protein n=1 Tax=Soboliphyme baturini TaxID=241478 RepID=A0A183J4J4_9BILA
IIVYVIDHIFPTKPAVSSTKKEVGKKDKKKKSQKEAEHKLDKHEKASDKSDSESTSNSERELIDIECGTNRRNGVLFSEEPVKATDDKVRRRAAKSSTSSSPKHE